MFGMGQVGAEGRIVGENKKAFAVVVQSSNRMHSGNGNEIPQGGAAPGIGELGQHIEGFVEKNEPSQGGNSGQALTSSKAVYLQITINSIPGFTDGVAGLGNLPGTIIPAKASEEDADNAPCTDVTLFPINQVSLP